MPLTLTKEEINYIISLMEIGVSVVKLQALRPEGLTALHKLNSALQSTAAESEKGAYKTDAP